MIITPGDPAGIGYEIACKFMTSQTDNNFDIALAAHESLIKATFENVLKLPYTGNFKIIEPDAPPPAAFKYGELNPECGKAAISYIDTAVKRISAGEFDAVVTCPINKKAIHMAGYNFPGHTEYLAYLAGVKKVSMLLAGNNVKTILATTHCPVSEIAGELTKEKIIIAIENAHKAGRYFGTLKPKIAVCALNPHAGDSGVLGSEEETVIKPAVNEARSMGFEAYGPLPADTLFVKASEWDFIIAAYHDQGMIAVKMDSFGEAVNVTLNLPFIRTSVDHGTAFDIAGRGEASCSSLQKACDLADKMVKYDKSFGRV